MGDEVTTSRTLWTVGAVLEWTAGWFARRGIRSARLDAEVLLAHVLGVDRVRLYVDYHRPLTPSERAAYRALVTRRARGEPVAYLVGQREFWSLALRVTPDVLIPRPETEALVELTVSRLSALPGPILIADVGTGSGAIAIALAVELAGARIEAIDISPRALAIARDNASRHDVSDRIAFHEGRLLDPVRSRWGQFDAVVSNPPYIPSTQIESLQREVRDHEPRAALDGGPDGLRVIEPLVRQAAEALKPGGMLALETGGETQASHVEALIEATGAFTEVESLPDASGTVTIAWAIRGRVE